MSQKGKAGLEVRLLGGFSARSAKGEMALPSRPAQSLFAYLMLNAGTAYRREKLAGMLWPDSTEESARDYLRHALWRIRKALQEASAASVLRADDLTIGIDAGSDFTLDAATVRNAAAAKDAGSLMAALSAYGGELLPGFYEEWVVLEREHLQAVYEREMERLLGLLQETGSWDEVLTWAEKWIALGQRPEPAYRALMLAHAAHGDMSKVATSYERCIKTLKDFGVEPSEQTRGLYEDIKAGKFKAAAAATVHPKVPVPAERADNIPVPLTSFIGRERELKKIAELLGASRLVTLTGPGGVGKTRLAIEAARAAVKHHKDGVFWVSLSALSDENLIAQEVAQAVDVREAPSEPLLTTLIRQLKSRQALLVLDNCEHLIRACAQFAEQLLAGCPGLSILATSIEGLGLFGETVWQVPSLPLPQADARLTPVQLHEIESVGLFEDRAARANPEFALSETNAADVAQICTRLDGIPLAIELAAARTKVLSVHEIAARLDDRFSLLTSGSRTAIPRHQTLRAAIDWSHELLSEQERTLLRQLGVFAGGFTLEAAQAVCGADLGEGELIDQLGRLVDKSLVAVVPSEVGEATRYRLLETIRQYALEKLIAAGEAPAIRDRHLEHFMKLAEDSEGYGFGTSGGWWPRLVNDFDNIRAAIEWSISSQKAVHALRILGASVYFWFARGHQITEWNDAVRVALERPGGKERTAARAKALNGMGFWYWAELGPTDRRADLEEALAIGRELKDDWNVGTALRSLGLLEISHGNEAAARDLFGQSLEVWHRLGPEADGAQAISLIFLGDLELNLEHRQEAGRLYEESARILRGLDDKNWLAYSVRRLGELAWRSGDLSKARVLVEESLRLNREASDPRGLVACLAAFAAIAAHSGDMERAAILAAAAKAQLDAWGTRLFTLDRKEFERTLASAEDALKPAQARQLAAKGAALSIEQALALATGSPT